MTAIRVSDGHPESSAGSAFKRRVRNTRLRGLNPVSTRTAVSLAVLAGLHLMTAALFLTSSAGGETAGWNRLPIDDAWTRMVYARSFAESFTFEFNDGEAASGISSPLWAVLTGGTSAVLGISSAELPAIAKVMGILFGIASVWMVYRITWQITRRRNFGLFAAAVLAVEPNFGFAAVSGTEVTMFAATSLAASWAYLRGRTRTAGLLVALAVAARPEALLLVALIVGATLARWMWRREGAVFQKKQDVRDIAFLALPSLVVVITWVVYNWSVAGSALPASYLAVHEDVGLAPLSNLWNVWLGYLHELPFMSSLAWVVGLPLILLGIHAVISHHSFSAVPITLFALALVYAAMVTFTRPDTVWRFADRQHMDAAVPFLVILLAAGTARAWQIVWLWKRARKPRTDRELKAVMIATRVAVAALVIAPLAALPVRWQTLTSDYAWNSRNIEEVNVSMGRWLEANTPEDAVVGAVPAGAIRFHSNRRVLDLSGANTHDAIGSPALGFGIEQQVNYLVAFREPFFDSIPDRAVIHEEFVSVNTVFDSNVMRAYGPPDSIDDSHLAPEQMVLFDPAGLVIIDSLDVGNISAANEVSESAHDYDLEGDRFSTTLTMRIADSVTLTDDAMVFHGSEAFDVASVPGQSLTVVKRYDATAGGSLLVFADGIAAGRWDLPIERTFFGETAFTVAAELVTGTQTRLRFEVIPGSSAIAGNSFYYWILVPEGSAPHG